MGTCHRLTDIHRGSTRKNGELKFQEADFVVGHTITLVVLKDNGGPRPPKMIFLGLEKQKGVFKKRRC